MVAITVPLSASAISSRTSPPGAFALVAAASSCFRRSVNFRRTSSGMPFMGKLRTPTRALAGPLQSMRTMRSPMMGAARSRFSTSLLERRARGRGRFVRRGASARAAGGLRAAEPRHHLVDLPADLVVGRERTRLLERREGLVAVAELRVADRQVVVRLEEVGMLGDDVLVHPDRLRRVAGGEVHGRQVRARARVVTRERQVALEDRDRLLVIATVVEHVRLAVKRLAIVRVAREDVIEGGERLGIVRRIELRGPRVDLAEPPPDVQVLGARVAPSWPGRR